MRSRPELARKQGAGRVMSAAEYGVGDYDAAEAAGYWGGQGGAQGAGGAEEAGDEDVERLVYAAGTSFCLPPPPQAPPSPIY